MREDELRRRKHSKGSILPDRDPENDTGCMATSAIEDTLKVDSVDELQSTKGGACSKQEDRNLPVMTNTDISICSYLECDGDVSTADSKDMNSDKSSVAETRDISVLDTTDNQESRSSSNGTVDLSCPESDGTASLKHNSNLSLLGHGPHGKLVVDHILKEYGDDGIGLFCHRWRQVFVEAIHPHPRYLPAGWDVMHSGRRDFSEFSVYNPAKKASAAAKS